MSVEDETQKLCRRWIVEYDCWRMCSEFSQSGTVDDGVRAAYDLSGNPYLENFGDRKTHGYRLLIHFMCKITETAKKLSTEEMSHENQRDFVQELTTLEQSIDLLDYISNAYTKLENDELREVKLCLRRFSVLAPLLKDDRITAKAVFQRQWLHNKNAEEKRYREELAAVIADPESAKSIANFDEVSMKCRGILQKIMMSMSKPFLLQAAETVCHKVGADCVESGPSVSRLVLQEIPIESPQKDVPASVVNADKLLESDGDNISDMQPSALQESASHTSGSKSTEISSVDDIWRPSTVWKKKGVEKAGKKPWSNVEEEQVYRGVLAHGVGNWSRIHTEFLPTRTNVDIKDKWRTMKRQGQLQTLADKIGPLPATCLY